MPNKCELCTKVALYRIGARMACKDHKQDLQELLDRVHRRAIKFYAPLEREAHRFNVDNDTRTRNRKSHP